MYQKVSTLHKPKINKLIIKISKNNKKAKFCKIHPRAQDLVCVRTSGLGEGLLSTPVA